MIPKFNHCKSCGMPMIKDEDFGGKNPQNDWCVNCCDQQGFHKSYEEVLEGMAKFMISKEGQEMSGEIYNSIEEAKEKASKYLKNMDAWKEN